MARQKSQRWCSAVDIVVVNYLTRKLSTQGLKTCLHADCADAVIYLICSTWGTQQIVEYEDSRRWQMIFRVYKCITELCKDVGHLHNL